eukprot:TRINITY_DN3044_c0_g1_i1.p1 TRINITY_DN3044_c0_g1~~TRINITY_DN3044_c0_g1_i1.p1  ORF type:complete len:364 (-),score=38.79 TRINITY_DN3044_c0_g1_i1:230-1288(-)
MAYWEQQPGRAQKQYWPGQDYGFGYGYGYGYGNGCGDWSELAWNNPWPQQYGQWAEQGGDWSQQPQYGGGKGNQVQNSWEQQQQGWSQQAWPKQNASARKGKGKGKGKTTKVLKRELRFSLNDRVVCNLGIRWVAGHIVGTDPDESDEWCYLVKTDPHPGLEQRTISVPEDSEYVCVQEVCFGPGSMIFTKGAAPEVAEKPSSRFKAGDRVSCRIRSKSDKLENWRPGTVETVNYELPEPHEWGEADEEDENDVGISGTFPAVVAYRVKLDNGHFVHCHADNYTLIRREGLAPQTRVKGVSKRMEDRQDASGKRYRFDHMTEKKKDLDVPEPEVKSSILELTDEEKKALFID